MSETLHPVIWRSSKRVEFRDTDAAGIMHFSTYFTFMEEVEHEFLRGIGLSVSMQDGDEHLSWPRVSTSCDFRDVLRFEDEFTVAMHLQRRGEKSVTYGFRFLKDDRLIAEGTCTSVCCHLKTGQRPQSIPIPAWIYSKIDAAARG